MDTTPRKRSKIITLAEHSSMTQRQIATECHIGLGTVNSIIKRYRETGSITPQRKGNCGRKRKTSPADDRLIVRKSKLNPRLTAVDLTRELMATTGVNIHVATVRRRLLEAGRRASYLPPIVRSTSIASLVPFPFLKPKCSSSNCPSILEYKRRFSIRKRIFAECDIRQIVLNSLYFLALFFFGIESNSVSVKSSGFVGVIRTPLVPHFATESVQTNMAPPGQEKTFCFLKFRDKVCYDRTTTVDGEILERPTNVEMHSQHIPYFRELMSTSPSPHPVIAFVNCLELMSPNIRLHLFRYRYIFTLELNNERECKTNSALKAENPHDNITYVVDGKTACE
ncbi:hypothetical protein ANN_04425 [Periplaneta americana]|uniref:Transposase Tc1-like domain-containing protein n=1 Tax=Periplaneta americana TaxID=6978 RepID=A0ABQ8TAJ6_PERAM|nr:hypothetical protein ANN_04425 [Periplaneta americana]